MTTDNGDPDIKQIGKLSNDFDCSFHHITEAGCSLFNLSQQNLFRLKTGTAYTEGKVF